MSLDLIISAKALDFGIDPDIVRAIVEQESGGDPFAVRFEPAFKYFMHVDEMAKRNRISAITEEKLQAMSFGLMQIMGSTAREYGYGGNLLALAADPLLGVLYGVKYLADLYHRYGFDPDPKTHLLGWEDPVIAAYNAGSARRDSTGRYVNEDYVQSVKGRYAKLKSSVPATLAQLAGET